MKYDPTMETRVLTLHQPWASLMAWGEKRNETRPGTIMWKRYRGWVAIHASANGLPARQTDMANESYLTRELGRRKIAPWDLPLGKILCVLRFIDSHKTYPGAERWIIARERDFGDYSPGRWVISTDNVLPLANPIPWKGKQGLPRAPLELRKLIAAQL